MHSTPYHTLFSAASAYNPHGHSPSQGRNYTVRAFLTRVKAANSIPRYIFALSPKLYNVDAQSLSLIYEKPWQTRRIKERCGIASYVINQPPENHRDLVFIIKRFIMRELEYI